MSPSTLLAWRERLGFNQSEAARRLGCSRNAYLNWETGHSKKIPLYIELACEALEYRSRLERKAALLAELGLLDEKWSDEELAKMRELPRKPLAINRIKPIP